MVTHKQQSLAVGETAQAEQHVPQAQRGTGNPELHELLWGIDYTEMGVLSTFIFIPLIFSVA